MILFPRSQQNPHLKKYLMLRDWTIIGNIYSVLKSLQAFLLLKGNNQVIIYGHKKIYLTGNNFNNSCLTKKTSNKFKNFNQKPIISRKFTYATITNWTAIKSKWLIKKIKVLCEITWLAVKSNEGRASLSLLCAHTQERPRPSHAADPATTSAVMHQLLATFSRSF